MFSNASFEDMLLLQIKYGKRNGASFSDWILKKRTLSIAALIISNVSTVDFYNLETAIYFHCVPDICYSYGRSRYSSGKICRNFG